MHEMFECVYVCVCMYVCMYCSGENQRIAGLNLAQDDGGYALGIRLYM